MFFVGWIVLSILIGAYASSKKRSGGGWFFLSLIISPLIAFIILVVSGPPPSVLKKCPKCAEEVKAEAMVCRFCHYDFSPPPVIPIIDPPLKPPHKSTEEIKKLASDYLGKMESKQN